MSLSRPRLLLLLTFVGTMLIAANLQAQDRRNCAFGPRMIHALGLTGAQQDKVDSLHAKTLDSLEDVYDEIDEEEQRLSSLYKSPDANKKKITATLNRLDSLEQQIDARWLRFREDVMDLLTDEQLETYNRYYSRGSGPGADADDDDLWWGRGRGRGYGYGRGGGNGYGRGGRGYGYGRGRGNGYGRGGRGYGRGWRYR